LSKIEVRRTSVVINDYTFGDCPELERKFRFWDEVYFREYYKGIKYIESEHKLYIPRSIDLDWVSRIIGSKPKFIDGYDKYDKNGDILMQTMPRDDDQKTAMRFVLGLGEYERYREYPRQMLALNTGKGKTFVAVSTLAFTMIKGIIIAPNIGWLDQWKDKILEYTDIKPNEIYMIQGSPTIARILNGRDMSKFKVFLASTATLKAYAEKNGWGYITDLFKKIKVGYKIYDEAHLAFDSIMAIDYATNTYKTLYLTATPGRSDEKENEIYQLYINQVPMIDLFHPDEDPRTQYIAFKYNSRLNAREQGKCISKYGFNKNNYCNQVIHKENFHNILHIVMDMIKRVNGKTLIYIATNDAILFIYNWITINYPEYAGNIGIYTSINSEKKAAKDKFIILSTTKSCGAAEDIDGLKMTVQLAEPMKSKILSRQSLGRTRARHTVYLDIIDMSTPATKSYYLQRLPLFNKYATSCKEVSFNDTTLADTVNRLLSQRSPMIIVNPFEHIDSATNPFSHRWIINPFVHI